MDGVTQSFRSAWAHALQPRMLWLTSLPFIVAVMGWGAFFWFTWRLCVDLAHRGLEHMGLASPLYQVFDWIGLAALHAWVAPFIVGTCASALMIVTVLLLIATMAMPMVIRYLSTQHFAQLEQRRGGTWYGSIVQSLVTTLICFFLFIVTLPLWLIPPFFAVIPPLLWGWLTYRVMTYDALALHASRDERLILIRRHRLPLLAMGIASGLMSMLPMSLSAGSMWFIVLFPLIVSVMIWFYSFILIFSALWFAHYCLNALQVLRANETLERVESCA